MVLNDRMKGQHYRAFLTRLASKRNVENIISELTEYYNNINKNIDKLFQSITERRTQMLDGLATIYEKTKHFEYVLNHFKLEVDAHILEKFNKAIESFENGVGVYVIPYEKNLFNHRTSTDQKISDVDRINTLNEWERAVNIVPSSLGIQWYGGKIKDRTIVNILKNTLRIVKVNTSAGSKNEDYINSNLILEIFIYSASGGIVWLQLGQNATFGFSIIVKYQSELSKYNMKINTESYNTIKEFDLNTFDFDMILNTMIEQEDVKNGNVYIKIKTNIPASNESGKDHYLLTRDGGDTDPRNMKKYNAKRAINQLTNKLVYQDNKDVAFYKHRDEDLSTLYDNSKHLTADKTPNLLNAQDDVYDYDILNNAELDEKLFTVELNCKNKQISQIIKNPFEESMNTLSDIVSGYVIANSDMFSSKNFFEAEPDFNVKFSENGEIKYYQGQQVIDLSDETRVGELSPLLKNETMYDVTNLDSVEKTFVVPSETSYGKECNDTTVKNNISNNANFENMLSTDSKNEQLKQTGELLNNDKSDPLTIYCVKKISDDCTIISTSVGVYRFNFNTTDPEKFRTKIQLENGSESQATKLYDIVVEPKNNIIFFGTDQGIQRYDKDTNKTYGQNDPDAFTTGTPTGHFTTLFVEPNGLVIAMRDPTLEPNNGLAIIDGEKYPRLFNVNRTRTNQPNKFVSVATYFGENQPKYYTATEEIIKCLNGVRTNGMYKPLTDIDYERINDHNYNVIVDQISKKIFFYIKNGKLLVASAFPEDTDENAFTFTNFQFVEGLKNRFINSVVKVNRKLYIGTDDVCYCYDIDTESLEELQFDYSTEVNHRMETRKIYFLEAIDNIFDTDMTDRHPTNCLIYYCNNNLFVIPKDSWDTEVVAITYVNNMYYVLTTSGDVYKYNSKFEPNGIITTISIPRDISYVDNVLLLSYDDMLTTDFTTRNQYNGFAVNTVAKDGVITQNILNR